VSAISSKLNKDKLLYKYFKDYNENCDDCVFNLGFYIEIINNNFQILSDIEKNIEPDKKKFYFIYIQTNYIDNLCEFMMNHNINKYRYITNENTNFNMINNNYKSYIEMNTDYFYHFNQIHFDYLFYTCIYHIDKSKCNFEKYIEWGKNLIEYLKFYPLIIITDTKTHKILNNEFDLDNITIIIKELDEMEYQCDEVFKQNTNKKYFPKYDIDYNLIKIWINRHLFIQDIQKIAYSNYYCYIDFGYIREPIVIHNKFDSQKLNPNKIYFGLVNNDERYINNLIFRIKNYNKRRIENTLMNDCIGGGFSIIPFGKIHYWITIFRLTFNKYLEKNIDFKDDQVILRQIILDKQYEKNFQLISTVKLKWFPFIFFLENNENVIFY
jgi:hypothetical protein